MIDQHVIKPHWFDALMELVDGAVEFHQPQVAFGFRWHEPESPFNPEESWFFAMYPASVEVHGGEDDGLQLRPGFTLDIGRLVHGFSNVEALEWSNPTLYDGELDGPSLLVKGSFVGNSVALHVYDRAPTDDEAVIFVDAATGEWWERGDR